MGIRLAAITDEISQEFEHALDVMLEYDVRGAELRGLWGVNIGDLDRAQTARAKAALSERGMAVACLATPIYKCDIETDDTTVHGRMHLASSTPLAGQMELLKRCCGLAHEFATPFIRVFAFWRKAALTADLEQRIVNAFAEPAAIAKQEGVTLLLENEFACMIGTGVEVARVVRAIDSPHVRVCWDPGNAATAGERAFPDGYEAARGLIDHVHVKDLTLAADGISPEWCVVGQGIIGYDAHIAAMRTDGYDGYLSLETHYVPKGGTPEDGSRPCLQALRTLLGV